MSGVDWDRLMSLRDDIGADDFAEVVLLFFTEIGEKLDQMGAMPSSAEDFHFLRGSAANLGFTAMVRACEEAEATCKAGGAPDLAAVMRSFEDALTKTQAHVPELAAARGKEPR
jgi:histidine phosphotransfer protein HptB